MEHIDVNDRGFWWWLPPQSPLLRRFLQLFLPGTTNDDDHDSILSVELYDRLWGGMELAVMTLILTAFLEMYSWKETVQNGVWKQPNGKQLYMTAIVYNIINHIMFGIPTYAVAVSFCRTNNHLFDEDYLSTSSLSAFQSFMSTIPSMIVVGAEIIYILIAHSIQYYWIHRSFHEHPTLYRRFHRFHHRFNVHVPPTAANAVTIGEYLIAYVVPFAIATLCVGVSLTALRIAISIQSFCNLIVHTPKFESCMMRHNSQSNDGAVATATDDDGNTRRAAADGTTTATGSSSRSTDTILHNLSLLWVTTNDHLDHHRKLHCHYASPTLNIDNIIAFLGSSSSSSLSKSKSKSSTSDNTSSSPPSSSLSHPSVNS